MSPDQKSTALEVVEPSALEAMERASIDVQISTAKKYPRSLALVKQKMLSFATLDADTAKSTFYTLPPRKGGEPGKERKPIEGPSIRMAEIAIASYGHLRAGARIIADDGKQITAQGVCHDLENNVCISVEVKRRVTTKDGFRYSDDMVVMTGNAACAIALRNAVFKVVPFALVKPVYEEAKKLATGSGDAKSLAARRVDAVQHFINLGVRKEKVFAAIEVKGMEDIGFEQIAILIGYANAVKDGETSLDEIFNPKPEAAGGGQSMAGILGEKKTDTPPPAAAETTPPAAEEGPAYTEAQLKALVGEVENLALNTATSTLKIFKIVADNKWTVPAKASKITDLSYATLEKVRDHLKAVAKGDVS